MADLPRLFVRYSPSVVHPRSHWRCGTVAILLFFELLSGAHWSWTVASGLNNCRKILALHIEPNPRERIKSLTDIQTDMLITLGIVMAIFKGSVFFCWELRQSWNLLEEPDERRSFRIVCPTLSQPAYSFFQAYCRISPGIVHSLTRSISLISKSQLHPPTLPDLPPCRRSSHRRRNFPCAIGFYRLSVLHHPPPNRLIRFSSFPSAIRLICLYVCLCTYVYPVYRFCFSGIFVTVFT